MNIGIRQSALLIAALGLAVSLYLVSVQYAGAPLACPTTGVINCENVLTSQYSKMFGIDNSALGAVFFLIDIILIIRYFGRDVLVVYNIIGFAFVLYYIFTEYLLGSICIYCTAVHVCVLLLLAISIKRNGRKGC